MPHFWILSDVLIDLLHSYYKLASQMWAFQSVNGAEGVTHAVIWMIRAGSPCTPSLGKLCGTRRCTRCIAPNPT